MYRVRGRPRHMPHRRLSGKSAPSYPADCSPYPLVVILGPTASGKSDLALAVAERYNGEVVNYDSVQVYRHFNVGTAKLSPSERRGIPHRLIDIVDPEELFTAGDYARRAREVLSRVRANGRLPVLAGGSGFYLRALLEGLFQGPQRDEALRRRLEWRGELKPAGYLHRLLQRLDRASAQRIHPNDRPKLIRAIEVRLRARAPMSSLWRKGREALAGYDVVRFGLAPPREALYERIRQRAETMFGGKLVDCSGDGFTVDLEMSGSKARHGTLKACATSPGPSESVVRDSPLVDEVRNLLAEGVSRRARAFGSLGYKQALEYVDGRLSLDQAIDMTAQLTRRFAKRQLTWFRREPKVDWVEGFGDDPALQKKVLGRLEKRLIGYQPE